MMTRRLLSWLIACILFFWVLVYTGFYQLLFILLAIVLLPLSALLFYLPSWRKINIQQSLVVPLIERGSTAELEIEVINSSRYFFPYVAGFCIWHNENGEKTIIRRSFMLRSRSSLKVILPCKTFHCGLFNLGVSRLAIRDIFGFFYWPRHGHNYWKQKLQTLTVIPAIKEDAASWTAEQEWTQSGITNSMKVSNELDSLANIRNYRQGDPLKRVHWKLSARHDRLMVKEFEDPRKRFICFSIDPGRPTDYKQAASIIDWQLETAAASMQSFLQNHRQIRWLDANREWQAGEADNLEQFELVKHSMAHYNPLDCIWSDHLTMSLAHGHAELLVLTTWRLEKNLANWLEDYAASGDRVVIQLIRNKDLDLIEDSDVKDQLRRSGVSLYEIEITEKK